MGSEGRLWAALAKVLAQGKEKPERAVETETAAAVSDEDGLVMEKERSRRETAKAH